MAVRVGCFEGLRKFGEEFIKEPMRKTAGLSNKLDPTEFSYLKGVYAGPNPTSPKGESSECFGKQVESSSARVAVAASSFGGQKSDKKEHSEEYCALLETFKLTETSFAISAC